MLTKEQYDLLKRIKDECVAAALYDEAMFIRDKCKEYDAANPPKPQVKCPACGHQMVHEKDLEWWHCDNVRCLLHGPLGDPDGSKVMALGKRKLPLERNRQYHVYNGRAHEVLMYNGIKTEGDPIDISEFFE